MLHSELAPIRVLQESYGHGQDEPQNKDINNKDVNAGASMPALKLKCLCQFSSHENIYLTLQCVFFFVFASK